MYRECITDSGCGSNTYNDISGECITCSPMCSECIYAGSNACTSCLPDEMIYLYYSEIIGFTYAYACICLPGTFFDSGTCNYCDGCSQCVSSADNCLECSDDLKILISDNGVGYCECIENYEENASGNCEVISLYQGCAGGQFKDDNDICINCDATCAACNAEGPDACVTCKPNSFLEGSSCIAKDGYIFSENNEIHKCPDNCEICTSAWDIASCELCNSGHFLSGDYCYSCSAECSACNNG